jgi:DMSO/TMAO reductase YedYZ molybdopterin-dependent catalytic subunit
MAPISRGFGGRRDDVDPSRIPPGQCYERGLPVLSAGPTPRTPLEEWTFSIQRAVDEARSWTWDEFTALPAEEVTGAKPGPGRELGREVQNAREILEGPDE